MKKLLLLITYFFVVVSAFAFTTPEKINYQGVARNADGELLTNQQLGIQIQIRTITSNGDVVYSEIHTVTTNQYGIFNLQIGGGGAELGAFADVDWGLETFFELSIDFEGGENFVSMGTSQLVAVPYALHAKQADNVFSGDFNDLVNTPTNVSDFANDAGFITNADDADADATNEIQDLSLVGSTLKITNNATATEINLAPFSGTNTDEQTLSLTGTDLSISNGNLVDLSSLQDGVDDADADATNEIQQISLIGSTLEISNDASTVDLSSFYDNTDAQTLSLVGTEVSISGGNTIDVAALQDGFEANTDAQTADEFSLSGTTLNLSLSGDGEATQTVDLSSLAGSAASITSSGNVASNASNYASEDFVIGSPQLANDGDASHLNRLFFDKSKAAFRVGYTSGTQWDNSNIGQYSIAAGRNTIADGRSSSAFGEESEATGSISFAAGRFSIASGIESTAIGRSANASGESSVALGRLANTTAKNATALGYNVTTQSFQSTVVGSYNLLIGDNTNWVATDPVFVVGNGNGSRSNAITVLKNGNMGIGVTDPDAKLEVNGQMKITGGTPGAGKVLTSDAAGLASWVTPAAGGGTDDQTIDFFTFSGTELGISLEDDNQSIQVVDLAPLQDGFEANTDNQTLSISGNDITILGGNTITIPSGGSGTDDQVVDVFSLSGTTLNLSLESDGQATQTVNLSSLQDGTGTDNQSLSISGNDITITGGNTITIPSGGSGTDDQVVDVFSLSGTTLNLSLESDGEATQTVNLSSLQDGTGTDTQGADIFSFDGSNLSLSLDNDGEATQTVDLSSLAGGGGTDDQTVDVFTLSGTTLNLSLESDGQATKTVNLSSLQDGFEANTDNQVADVFSLTGSTLNLSLSGDGQATKTVDLSSLSGGGTDDQKIDVAILNGTNLELSLESDAEATKIIDLSSLQDGVGAFSNVGIVTSNANGNTQTDDFVFGSPTLDNGNGDFNYRSRFFFDKSKAAFRAGYSGLSWDIGKLGNYSAAFGFNSEASGENSFAHGYYSKATDNDAIAIGYGAIASDGNAVALGKEAEASWAYATAIGYQSLATKWSATAIGQETQATSLYATAIGYQSVASGNNSVALGNGTSAQSHSSLAVGRYNYTTGDASNWVLTDPLFVVGNGSSLASRKNALVVLKNGNVKIGSSTVAPTHLLEVDGTLRVTQTATLHGVLQLVPRATAPAGTLGSLYVNTNGKIYFHNGTIWKEVSLVP